MDLFFASPTGLRQSYWTDSTDSVADHLTFLFRSTPYLHGVLD